MLKISFMPFLSWAIKNILEESIDHIKSKHY